MRGRNKWPRGWSCSLPSVAALPWAPASPALGRQWLLSSVTGTRGGDKSSVAAVRAQSGHWQAMGSEGLGQASPWQAQELPGHNCTKEQQSIQSRTSQWDLSLPQTLPSPCWVPKRVFGVNPVALTSCSTRSAPLLPQWEKWENLSVEIKTI